MSTQQEHIEVDGPASEASLSSPLDGDPPFTIHGIAIGDRDVTRGKSKIRKIWPSEELSNGAESLENRVLVKNHNNDVEGVVGEVTDAKFKPGVGVLYQAELDDRKLAEKVANGRLDVSPRILHTPVDELEEHEELDAVIVEGVKFDNLSLVASGASPSNTVQIGEHEELSHAELAAEFGVELENDVSESDDASEMLESDSEPAEAVEGITVELDDEELELDGDEYDISELASEYELHIPNFQFTRVGSWKSPNKSDFRTDDLNRISEHYLLSRSGFPPDNFQDLKLPVVDTMGGLNLKALRIAKRVVSQVDGIEEERIQKAQLIINSLISGAFPNQPMSDSLGDAKTFDEVAEELGVEAPEVDVAELVSYHTPDYSETVTGRSWDGLDKEDFSTDDLSEIDDHFIASDSNFPPDGFSDLSFEVVDTDGSLVLDALKSAWTLRGHADDPDSVGDVVKDLASEFEWSPEDSEENEEGIDGGVDVVDGEHASEFVESDEELESENQSSDMLSVPLMHDRSADDPGQSVRAMVAEMSADTMNAIDIHHDDLPEEAEELGQPVLVDRNEYEELQDKAQNTEEKFDKLQESLDELSDVREEKDELEERVEELEEKASEVDEVKMMYAEELAEGSPFEAEELTDAHDLQTLRDKVDETEEEELEESDPEPRGEDVEEEELEGSNGPDEETEERVEELEEKVEFYEHRGWEGPAEELREELEEIKQ